MASFVAEENSRASSLYNYVRATMPNAGDSISYEETFEIVGMDPTPDPGSVLANVVARVNRRLARDGDWRHLQSVTNTGYRIADPEQLRCEAFGRDRAVRRQMARTQQVMVKAARHPDATVAERKRATDAATAHAGLIAVLRRGSRQWRAGWPADEVSPVLTDDVAEIPA